MAATAPRNLVRERRAAGATPVFERPTTSSEVPIDAIGPGIVTALGYYSDPSLPVVQGMGAGGIAGLAAMAIGLLLLGGSVSPSFLDAVAPTALLLGFVLGGAAGGMGGLLVLLAGQRPGRAGGEEARDEPAPQA